MKKLLLIFIFFQFFILDSYLHGQIVDTVIVNKNVVQTDSNKTDTTSFKNAKIFKPIEDAQNKLTDIFSAGKILSAVIFLLITFYFLKLLTSILNKLSEKSVKYRISLKGTIPILRITIWTTSIAITIIVIFAPPIESLVVVTGSLGIAIGFASQDILRNIFGGILILMDRPFQVGDKVEIGSHYGEVMSIGLRSCRIVTPDDSMVSIPNGEIMSKAVSNSNTGESNCQVVAEIFLPVYIDTQKVREIAIRSAQISKYIYLNKPIAVIFKNEIQFGRSVLKLRLKAYVLDIRYEFNFMSEMTEITIKELLNNNIVTKEELSSIQSVSTQV